MSIIRGPRPADRYAQISNDLLQDRRLSFRARGIGASILSRPEGWETSQERLAAESPTEGVAAVRTAMRELEAYGYSFYAKMRRERGRVATVRWVFDRVEDAQAYAAVLEHEGITVLRSSKVG